MVSGLREWLLGQLAGRAVAPILRVLSAFMLLFGGIFLGVAWLCGPQHLLDAYRYAPYTAQMQGRIVDSWLALEFDPAVLPKDALRWQPYARIQACAEVAYGSDRGSFRRAYCGNRFSFSDDFRLDDWDRLAPDVPFAFQRDAAGFQVMQLRLSKAALTWLSTHPPHDTFMFGKPAPTTALEAFRQQYDQPLTMAIASWSRADAGFPLRYDPRHPDSPLPAGIVEARRNGMRPGMVGLVLTLILGAIGVFVWRAGMRLLTGQAGVVLWLLTLLPLLALPWWSDVLPRLIRNVNNDWADLAEGMLDDINRVTRFTASAPEKALLADGERMQWRTGTGIYADSFGRLPFIMPQPRPASADAAFAALQAQVREAVGKLDSAARAALFLRLRELHDAEHDDVQRLFPPAAEDTLGDAGSDAKAHRAARDFLIHASGKTYYDDQLDRIERAPVNAMPDSAD